MEIFGVQPGMWFPVVTLLLGAILKAVFDAMTDRRLERREQAARHEARRDAFRLRHSEFQRATLLELQDAVVTLARLTGQSHYQDLIAYRTKGTWQREPNTDDVSEGFLKSQQLLSKLRVRVSNDRIRELTKDVSSACADTVHAPDEMSATLALSRMSDVLSELQDSIGDMLRSLDEDDATADS
ncbi:hypothetical protein [Pandoraea iniqua]|uniref:hypothetical protein n=1 Tax=Pandoraea iniqua TaxID=2508288 RepID=UPI001240CF35|nr:hypothetical protein [Pandoraea iniqua]